MEQNKKNLTDKIHKFTLAIIYKEHNKIIGYCGLGLDDLEMGEIEIYYNHLLKRTILRSWKL